MIIINRMWLTLESLGILSCEEVDRRIRYSSYKGITKGVAYEEENLIYKAIDAKKRS